MLIGETWTKDIDELKQYYGEHSDELQMPMDFMFATVDKLSAPRIPRADCGVSNSGGWPVYVISNHDIVRSYNRYGDGKHNDAIAKLMAGLYLTLRGTPIMYYGEELGMENNDPKRREDVKDPIGRLGWPKEKGRDGERTPMQWNTARMPDSARPSPGCQFPPATRLTMWRPSRRIPDSILNFYRRVLALRHQDPALRDGEYVALNESDPNVLSYLRRYKDEAVLVVLNMSSMPQRVSFNLQAQGLTASKATTMLTTGKDKSTSVSLQTIALDPFAVYIGKVGQ